MDWPKYWIVQLISVLGGISGILGLLAMWNSAWRGPLMIGVVIFCVLFFIAEHQKDRVTVLFSGVQRYYRAFGVNQNAAVFELVRNQYRYFGITFSSVKTVFTNWYLNERRGSPEIQILLSDPEADDILEFQARYETNLLTDPLTPEQRERVRLIVDRTKASIHSTLASFAALPGASPHLEVRLHRDRARRWTHEVDGETLYLGLLRRGSSGMNSSVMVLNRRKDWTLFDHHHDGWEGLWEASKRVNLTSWKGAAGAGT